MILITGPAVPERRFFPRLFLQQVLRVVGRVLAALSLIAAITFVLHRLLHVNATTTGLCYLVAILIIATSGGLIESTVASLVAMLCLNYFFLPPIGTLTIADPQNWVALFAFLVTSLTASQLSARAKRRTKEAIDRQYEIERLYSLSRGLLLTDATKPMPQQVIQQIAQAFPFRAVTLYDRHREEIHRGGEDDTPELEGKLREVALRSTVFLDSPSGLTITPVRLGGRPIGSLAIRGSSLSDAALQSLLNLVAIGLERALSQEAVNRAEVARQSEELKSTLLDAIAHEFKTPLTSIKAVTTDLLSDPSYELPEHQRELITIAVEGTDRLSRLVTDAIQLSRIEGGKFTLHREIQFPSSLVSAALRQMKSLMDGREITVSARDDLPAVWVDAGLIQMVITHLLDNALKYSPPGSPISISARTSDGRVMICVIDQGPGIEEDEQSRIFDRFYRGKGEQNLKGTGMGLAIAREIMDAHGEQIWVVSKPGEGSEFCFSLPTARQGGNE